MKKHSIGCRIMSLLLAAVMLLSMVPAIGVSATPMDANGYLGNVKPLNNNESISLPIKLNNFAMDGMLFEYLSSVYNNSRDAQYYLYETGGAYQLLSLHLANKEVGIALNGSLADKDGTIQPDPDAISSNVDTYYSLHGEHGTSNNKNYLGVTSGGAEYYATLAPYEMTDGGGAKYLRLRQFHRSSTALSGRTWRKLTTFTADHRTMSQSRYAVIIYRVNGNTYYDDMLLTWDCYDELSDRSNCSQSVPVVKNVNKTADANWQYAIIDLAYNLGDTEEEWAAAAAGTEITDIYLKTPLDYYADNTHEGGYVHKGIPRPQTDHSMDLAAVAYFPYYGDAEQFVHYGLSLGCDLKYYYRDNRGFDFMNATRTSGDNSSVPSVSQWDDANFGKQLYNISTTTARTLQDTGSTTSTTINTLDELSYALFGGMQGYATMGLLESQLGENGRPVYKEVVVDFLAMYLQNRLTGVEEYPSDNHGWKNYSFVTGVSTTSDIDEQLFGKDNLGHSIDLATALCDRVEGAVKGGGTVTGKMGTYDESRAKADALIGTWDQCEGNIKTWFDAAYYLLHNLYVSDEDTAYDGDSYGEYEDDFHHLIMQQVHYKETDGKVTDAYAFDSGFCKNNDTTDSAVVYDRENHTLSNSPAANATEGRDPFLPSSGTGTEIGETNSPYYIDDYVIQHGRGYRKRDYLYTISGNGVFQFTDGLFFEFKGDDDVYLFINGQLVLDIGGTHSATLSKINLDDYANWAWSIKNGKSKYKGLDYEQLDSVDRARVDALALEEGGVYDFDFFYMERHGAGANLRIVTNIKVTGEGLNVDKTAYQNGVEIPMNGVVNVNAPIEYGFKVTNETVNVLYNFSLQDTVIGVSLDHMNGLVIAQECVPYVKNANGDPLTVADLEILVSGKDANGNDKDIVVTCATNDELKAFLTDLTSDDGTASGEGLWKDASIQIRGVYYNMTDAQKEEGNLRNYVAVAAEANGIILRGADYHIVYSKLTYYQWAGKPIVIDQEQLYYDLLDRIVGSAEDLPALGDMILIPSDSNGIECQDNGIENTSGGDVYLKTNYTVPGTYVSYVTILDQNDPTYRLTVPVVVNVLDTKDSTVVLDYGLDAYLTDGGAIMDYELGLIEDDNITGTVMGIAGEDIVPSYKEYDLDDINATMGDTDNDLSLLTGDYANQTFSKAQYEMDNAIELKHTKPWVVEFKINSMTSTAFLFSENEDDATDGNEYLFLRPDFIALGHVDGSNYYNYAVATTALADSEPHVYKMYNDIASDGSNMVYLSIDDGDPVAMNRYYIANADQGKTDNTWINGKDFTFKFLGGSGRTLKMNMEYLHVYEEGTQLTHYRWEANGNQYVSTDTGKPGYEAVTPGYYDYKDSTGKMVHRWNKVNVMLNSDQPWELEFEMQIPTLANYFMLMASTGSEEVNKTKDIFIHPSKRFIGMGYCSAKNTYVSYGALLPTDFDMTKSHTYLLKNRVNADGTNMVYLYVDKAENGVWTEIGPLLYDQTGKAITSSSISGMDFNFKYIGGVDKYAFTDQKVSSIEVRQVIALNNYEWKAGVTEFATVDTVNDGNRIEFAKEESGIITDGDGRFTLENHKLKFEALDFMDEAYTAYTALTIHDKEHTHTALNQPGVDVSQEVQMFKKVSVIPANVVYYEDDFPAIHYVDDYVDGAGVKNVFEVIGESTLDHVQSVDQDTEYGSDEVYQNTSSTMSDDHIYKITIRTDSRLAWFEFKGTGFELISSTNATDSPMLYLEVYNRADVTVQGTTMTVIEDTTVGENGEATQTPRSPVAWIPLITEFDNQNNDGEEVIHQVPIIRWQREDDDDTTDINEALERGEYVVTINAYATRDYAQDSAPIIDSYLYIDGVRIFQPMGYANENYNALENNVIFDEIRNHIINNKIMVCEKKDAGVVISSGTVTWTENFNGLDYKGGAFEGNQVNNVNDYLLKGPNNEVYMAVSNAEDGSPITSSLAFVVYRNADEKYKDRDLGLQIGVRAIDAGNFYGTGASGLKANLEIGVTNANGTYSWTHLATVASGTEQYITIPYELCPVTTNNGINEYNVIIRVSNAAENIPAMVSFSSLKRTEGLELKEGIGEALIIYPDESGQWVTPEGEETDVTSFLMVRNALQTDSMISFNEAVRGENFVTDSLIPENAPAIMPQYPTLSFEGEVRYNIFYTVQNLGDVALEDMGLITFNTENVNGTVSDAVDVIPGAVFDGNHYIVHSNGIPAKNLGDTLYFKVYAKLADGSYVYSAMYNYSAKRYAQQQLAGNADAVKPLVVAMLNYGAAAQKFFGYKTDNLMNADLTADQQALVMNYHSGMTAEVVPADSGKAGMFVNNGGFTRTYPAVTFGGAFEINYFVTPSYAVDEDITLFFWDAETYNSVEELTAQNALGSKKMIAAEGTAEYSAAYTGIAAKEIGDTVYVAAMYESDGVTYCSGVLAYSLSKYCKRFAESAVSPVQSLAAATAVYGYYAEKYFAG